MYKLDEFIKDCRSCCQEFVTPADIVLEMSPLMLKLIQDPNFLKPDHLTRLS